MTTTTIDIQTVAVHNLGPDDHLKVLNLAASIAFLYGYDTVHDAISEVMDDIEGRA